MYKKISTFVLTISLLSVSVSSVQAESLFVVLKNGTVQRNVLGDNTDISATVQKVSQNIASAALEGVKEIAIAEIENKTNIKIITDTSTQDQTIPTAMTQLLEIEGDRSSDKVTVTKLSDGYGISQKGITAKTSFTVTIKPQEQEIYVNSGEVQKKLTVLPSEAVKKVVSIGAINILPKDGIISLESDGNNLNYLVKGERVVQIFQIAKLVVPVSTSVSATTGEVTVTDQPRWLSLFGFVLS